jgi:putative membrane protein
MTYLEFLLLFVILPTSVLIICGLLWSPQAPKQPNLRSRHWTAVLILVGIAFVWTTPWDNYLIAVGVWHSPPDRILGTIGYVPLEEYAFFLLMPISIGAILYLILQKARVHATLWRQPQKRARWIVSITALVCFSAGVVLLVNHPNSYLGLTVVWFLPALFIQCIFDPLGILRNAPIIVPATLLPTVYLWAADSFAIASGIWTFDSTSLSGFMIGNLPIEEAFFFFITSLLVAQGVTLYHSLFIAEKS